MKIAISIKRFIWEDIMEKHCQDEKNNTARAHMYLNERLKK